MSDLTEAARELADCKTGEELCEAVAERISAFQDELRGLGVSIVFAYEVEDAIDNHACHFGSAWLASPAHALGLAERLKRSVVAFMEAPDEDED